MSMAGKGKGSDPKGSAAKGKGKDDKAKKGKANEEVQDGKAVKACQQVNVRHILCEKHARKEEALTKLKDGAKFDDVAREFSEDKAKSGGALGWKRREELETAFATAAFDLAESTTAKPKIGEAKTGHGYHILMVEGRK